MHAGVVKDELMEGRGFDLIKVAVTLEEVSIPSVPKYPYLVEELHTRYIS